MSETITLPGLIDVHVHLRDPGQTQKEDFTSGTSAALAGGFTTIVDMPNNAQPITSIERLDEKRHIAAAKAVGDIGFHYGSLGDNLDTFVEAAKKSIGLKLYLNNTTGGYLLDAKHLKEIYAAWPKESVVLLHVEEDVIDIAIESMQGLERPVHVCHMPSKEILSKIIAAKKQGLPITCGVCPHHLFLTTDDKERLGVYGDMLPSLKTKEDQEYLWDHLDDIDIFESDHAPHTREEKEAGAHGVPGLETTLPLLLTAMKQGKITLDQIIEKCHTAPARIFNLPTDESTSVEVDMSPYIISNDELQTKCGWSPFSGQEVYGKVTKVILHGQTVYQNGAVLVDPGKGKVITRNA
jgi:dihydroorotase-like cyclic amidohydrolase